MQINVDLTHHKYDLLIEKNCLHTIGNHVANIWSKRKILIITDKTVEALYAKMVMGNLEEQGFDVFYYSIVPGENSKSLDEAGRIFEYLAEMNFTRSDGVIALGGGVVGDLAGFVASTYMRGVAFIQIPTTLLAQVDSSIGGKTAVNTAVAKNLVGTFYQPDGVFIDPVTLTTLSQRRLQEGLAEIIKSAAIKSPSLWHRLEKLETLNDCLESADELIYECCQIKKAAVVADEFDHGERLLLNFGHTIAHAIEKIEGYGVVTHGEAVAIGMVSITKNNERLHHEHKKVSEALIQMLTKFGLPTSIPNITKNELFQVIQHDKKVAGDTIKIVLLKEIGEAYVKQLSLAEFKNYL